MNDNFTFIDFFSGIGGFRIALEDIGGKCIGSSEIEKNAIDIYKKNWNNDSSIFLGDVTKIKDIPTVDLFAGGVPCQSWSIAGKNKGIEDPRGALWNYMLCLTKEKQPKAFIFENVKGLAEPRHKNALNYLIEQFSSYGYNVYFDVLNSNDYGLVQNRNRIYIIGIKKELEFNKFQFPRKNTSHKYLFEVFEDLPHPSPQILENDKNKFFSLTDIRNGPTSIHSWDLIETSIEEKEICMVILQNRRKSKYGTTDGNPLSFDDIIDILPSTNLKDIQSLIKKNILEQTKDNKYIFVNRKMSSGINGIARIYLPNSKLFPTITATGNKDFLATINIDGQTDEEYKNNFIQKVIKDKNYRPINNNELKILQGFPKEFIIHNKDRINVKLFGNSVSVPVIKEIALSIKNTSCFDK